MFAASKCHYEIARVLITMGAFLDVGDRCYRSALTFAIANQCDDIAKMLIKAGARREE